MGRGCWLRLVREQHPRDPAGSLARKANTVPRALGLLSKGKVGASCAALRPEDQGSNLSSTTSYFLTIWQVHQPLCLGFLICEVGIMIASKGALQGLNELTQVKQLALLWASAKPPIPHVPPTRHLCLTGAIRGHHSPLPALLTSLRHCVWC